MSRQQSLNRAIKRGNAAIYWNSSTMSPEVLWKKGATKKQWHYATNQMAFDERIYESFKEQQEQSIKEIMEEKNNNN